MENGQGNDIKQTMNAAFDAFFRAVENNEPIESGPEIRCDDAMRLAKQLDEKHPVIINSKQFAPGTGGTHQKTPDKDLYFLMESADHTQDLEIVLYTGNATAQVSYYEGTHERKTGVKLVSLVDADGNILEIL